MALGKTILSTIFSLFFVVFFGYVLLKNLAIFVFTFSNSYISQNALWQLEDKHLVTAIG